MACLASDFEISIAPTTKFFVELQYLGKVHLAQHTAQPLQSPARLPKEDGSLHTSVSHAFENYSETHATMLILTRETPVGYALLKAKSSKLLKGGHFKPEDDTAENICSLYVQCPSLAEPLHQQWSLTAISTQIEIERLPCL